MKILVVDDETDVKDLFVQKFRKEIKAGDISLIFAFSGLEALDLLKKEVPMDIILILSDINMPGMTGFELLQKVKELFPHLKVLMVSAYGDPGNIDKANQTGADGFISKPVDFDRLKAAIYQHKS